MEHLLNVNVIVSVFVVFISDEMYKIKSESCYYSAIVDVCQLRNLIRHHIFFIIMIFVFVII